MRPGFIKILSAEYLCTYRYTTRESCVSWAIDATATRTDSAQLWRHKQTKNSLLLDVTYFLGFDFQSQIQKLCDLHIILRAPHRYSLNLNIYAIFCCCWPAASSLCAAATTRLEREVEVEASITDSQLFKWIIKQRKNHWKNAKNPVKNLTNYPST